MAASRPSSIMTSSYRFCLRHTAQGSTTWLPRVVKSLLASRRSLILTGWLAFRTGYGWRADPCHRVRCIIISCSVERSWSQSAWTCISSGRQAGCSSGHYRDSCWSLFSGLNISLAKWCVSAPTRRLSDKGIRRSATKGFGDVRLASCSHTPR